MHCSLRGRVIWDIYYCFADSTVKSWGGVLWGQLQTHSQLVQSVHTCLYTPHISERQSQECTLKFSKQTETDIVCTQFWL